MNAERLVDPRLWALLGCPVDHAELHETDGQLRCRHGHSFEVVDGVPLLLHPDVAPDVPVPSSDLPRLSKLSPLGSARPSATVDIDPFVHRAIDATNGIMYKGLVGKLKQYPIPSWPLTQTTEGETLLDIGCNWGRWSLSATRSGYRVIGMDPNPEAIFAARRVAKQHGLDVLHVVGDARYLPFRSGTLDYAFSYSVLQHLSKPEATQSFREISRVLHKSGTALVEMPNAFGLRSLYHQARRRFQEPGGFDVRYWTPSELKRTFESIVGATDLLVDGFFSINPQTSDRELLPIQFRAVVEASEALKKLQKRLPALVNVADSLYVLSRKGVVVQA